MPYSSRKTMKRRPKTRSKKSKKNTTRKNYASIRKNVNTKVSIEKKVFDYTIGSLSFAQSNTAGVTGHNSANPTPTPSNGTAVNQRIGNRIMVTGARLDIEIQSMSSHNSEFRYRWYMVRVPDSGNLAPATDITTEFLDENPFATNIYDWHSPTDHERSSSFKIVASGTGKLLADQIAGQSARAQLRKYLKLGHILKFDNTGSPTPVVTNQYRMIFLGDSGDVTAATGATARFNIRWYYTDN